LIFLLADPTTDCRETILFTNDIRCADIVSLQNRANELRDVDFNWTAGYAGRVLAIDASLGLKQRLLFVKSYCYLAEVSASRERQLARHFLTGCFGCSFYSGVFNCHSCDHSILSSRLHPRIEITIAWNAESRELDQSFE
jgi:hypothetical protein